MQGERVKVWVQRFKDRAALMSQWTDPDTGWRRSKSAGTENEKEAEKARADLEYELNHGQHQDASRMEWDRFREMFEAEYLPGLGPRSREKYGTVLDVFEQTVNPARLRAINERTVSLFVKGLRERKHHGGKVGLAPHTIKNYHIAPRERRVGPSIRS